MTLSKLDEIQCVGSVRRTAPHRTETKLWPTPWGWYLS